MDEKEINFIELMAALEKQKPKAPDIDADGEADGYPVYDLWGCPNCGAGYEIDCQKFNYCPNCGQCIDWSQWDESEAGEEENKAV
jgi:hypothetical protein